MEQTRDPRDLYTVAEATTMIRLRASKMNGADEVLKFIALSKANLAQGTCPTYISAADFAAALDAVEREYLPAQPWLNGEEVDAIFAEFGLTFPPRREFGMKFPPSRRRAL